MGRPCLAKLAPAVVYMFVMLMQQRSSQSMFIGAGYLLSVVFVSMRALIVSALAPARVCQSLLKSMSD
jgi:hypothetical protein